MGRSRRRELRSGDLLINRGKQPMDELGFVPDKEVDKITDLPALLKAV